ncbi:hypothetical protein B0T18DRAFT_450023 [Schizothecium vesticola]|uniref:Chromate transporter n=1 Tax=Schizothecium vesticola TaxID=314040 RepID=A0AA40EDY2_9PEZI|nr:hypothetical protein B0T18DRAFT_450023 [Schizothecium vesticola]
MAGLFFFYNFGLFARGGPVAQIALIKDKLVVQDKWITLARFQRVFYVYQILPGPEAAELCMFFGACVRPPLEGVPPPVSLALGIAKTPSFINLFVLGLVAGTLSFGGAYTAIPFIQVEAVLMGAWLPQSVFIDAIAIGNILPAPLVIFATFVGFQGAYLADGSLWNAFARAVVITLGMFFPFFLFTIAGHEFFFDGLCRSVIGVIAVIAMQILKASVEGSLDRLKGEPLGEAIVTTAQVGPAAALYLLPLVALYKFTNKYTALLLVIVNAVAGQFLFRD